MTRYVLDEHTYIELYSSLAEAFVDDNEIIAKDGDIGRTEAGADQFIDNCNIVESILLECGIVKEGETRFRITGDDDDC